jgi:hypothetical protein
MYNIQYILLSQIWDQVPVFISPRNRVARLYPQALGRLPLSYWQLTLLCSHSTDYAAQKTLLPLLLLRCVTMQLPSKQSWHISHRKHLLGTHVYSSAAQHWAWRRSHRKHFLQDPFYCHVCIFQTLHRNESTSHNINITISTWYAITIIFQI